MVISKNYIMSSSEQTIEHELMHIIIKSFCVQGYVTRFADT